MRGDDGTGRGAPSLSCLFGELVILRRDLETLTRAGNDDAAGVLVDRMVEIEDRICDAPIGNLHDAAIKLQLLLSQLEGDLNDRQERLLADVLGILSPGFGAGVVMLPSRTGTGGTGSPDVLPRPR